VLVPICWPGRNIEGIIERKRDQAAVLGTQKVHSAESADAPNPLAEPECPARGLRELQRRAR
jgi:hypothetical protein